MLTRKIENIVVHSNHPFCSFSLASLPSSVCSEMAKKRPEKRRRPGRPVPVLGSRLPAQMVADVLTPSKTRTVTKTVTVKVQGRHVPRGGDDLPPPTSHSVEIPEPPPIPEPETNLSPQNAQLDVDPVTKPNPSSEQNHQPPAFSGPEPNGPDSPTNPNHNIRPISASMPPFSPILLRSKSKPADEIDVESPALQQQLQELVSQLESRDAELLRLTTTN